MACLAWGNYMLSHWFIGFYACFVALVFYFISASNHRHRAQTSPFGCIHCSPKHRGLKEVKRHEPSYKNKPKRSKSRSTRPELALAKVARVVQEHCSSQKLRITFLKFAWPVERIWLGSSEVHSKLLIISSIQFRSTGHPLDWSSKKARVERSQTSHSVQLLKFLMLDLMVARLVEWDSFESSEMGGNSFFNLFKYHLRSNYICCF